MSGITFKLMVSGLMVAALVACGGGGGGTSAPTPTPPPTPTNITITGTVAKGAVLANAAIVAKCADGSTFNTVSSSAGGFSLTIPGSAVPCLIQASGQDGTVWRSVGLGAGNASITPLTEMVLAKLFKALPGDAFASYPNAASVTLLTPTNVATAQTDVRTALNGISDLSVIPDFIATPFKAATATTPGDAIDQAIDALTASLKTKGSSPQAVTSALAQGKAVSSTFGLVCIAPAVVDGTRCVTPLSVTEYSRGLSVGVTFTQIQHMAAGPDGNMWVTQATGDSPVNHSGNGRIGRITPTGAITWFSAGLTPNAGPGRITAGADGNMWFTEDCWVSGHPACIGRITMSGEITEFSEGFSSDSHEITDITRGPDGNVWFTEMGDNKIGRITPTGAVTKFQAGSVSGSMPVGITTGPDGNLWFTEINIGNNTSNIARITPSGMVTEFSVGNTAFDRPTRITSGPDGNLWTLGKSSSGLRELLRITPGGVITKIPTAGLPPYNFDIINSPDGNLWLADVNSANVCQITPAGAAKCFPTVASDGTGIFINLGPDGKTWLGTGNGLYTISKNGVVSKVLDPVSPPGKQPASPTNIVVGPDGNLWFTEKGALIVAGSNLPIVGRITPMGGITEFSSAGIGATGAQLWAGPVSLTPGSDGAMWFVRGQEELNKGTMGRIAADGVVSNFSIPTTGYKNGGRIVTGPDGALWFAEEFYNARAAQDKWYTYSIGRMTTAGAYSSFSAGLTPNAYIDGITVGPDGNIWFAETGANKIGRITPSGVITEFSAGPTTGSALDPVPRKIIAGPDGNLWFTKTVVAFGGQSWNAIGRITTGGVVTEFGADLLKDTSVTDITSGPDGNVWFTESAYGVNRLGRITPAGVITEFKPNGIAAGAGLIGITTGRDGKIWFTEAVANKIGNFTPP